MNQRSEGLEVREEGFGQRGAGLIESFQVRRVVSGDGNEEAGGRCRAGGEFKVI